MYFDEDDSTATPESRPDVDAMVLVLERIAAHLQNQVLGTYVCGVLLLIIAAGLFLRLLGVGA
jgi:hypothetical protein